ncbi:MAG TPA: hypothetical protein VJV03_15260 [Pyrinomonadaceae bacterium]|nr:hypothetical protein [Pyrinomonadaceae bacterium]
MRSNQRPRATAESYVSQIKADLKDAWLPSIYTERIRKLRTRAYTFESLPVKSPVEIQHTLLGVELQAGRRRMLCPDLATARYLSVFAKAGCKQIAVPYDITKISQLADQLDSAWHRALLLADYLTAGEGTALRSRVRRMLVDRIRDEVESAGAGPATPTFEQSTKQRR